MIDTREQIEQRLVAIVGLELSGAGRAADMLTLQFGPLREMTTKHGNVKHVGAWSLHIQCGWRIERANEIFADASDFAISDDAAHATLEWIRALITDYGPLTIERVVVGDGGNVSISMPRGLGLTIVTDAAPDEEDWRFFEPGSEAKHFVIQGGKVDPWSLT
ncbi:hypothetical protein WS97_00550 [Burkholderia territorii]|uniref:hypothetical protein n=1 Tax=Burkholderia territorii TaxID=1503055 RepID=UPI00075A9A0F|nr:hypothetical protein [Burkholderia territorii]KVL25442.1 hypothetical protein WS97_00550 [Burkholderia territorii]